MTSPSEPALSEPVAAGEPAAVSAAGHSPAASRRWTLTAIMATMFMTAIEGTIVATATPTIVGDLGGFRLLSWVFSAYLLTQAVTIPIYGRLADLYGRRRVLIGGVSAFLIASVLCGLSWDMISLVTFRGLQGIAAGAILPVAMTVVGDLYPPAQRARIQGYLSSVWAIAAIIGPVLGALVLSHLSWPWIFWINLPLGIPAGILLAVMLKERVEKNQRRIDYLGSGLMMLGTGTLMFTLIEAASLGAADLSLLLAAAFVVLAAFIVHESRIREPILPLALLHNPVIAGADITNFVVGAAMMGTIAFLPTYMQAVMGRSAFIAGIPLAAMSFAWPVGSATAGRIMLWKSYRTSATLGGIVIILGSMALIGIHPGRGVLWIGASALVAGYGMGLANNSFLVATQASVDWSQRGIATSSIVFMRLLGQSVGTAVFGGILNAYLSRQISGSGDLVSRIVEPALRQGIAASELAPATRAIADAVHIVYLICGGLALAVLATSTLLPRGLSPVRPARNRH